MGGREGMGRARWVRMGEEEEREGGMVVVAGSVEEQDKVTIVIVGAGLVRPH